MTFIPDAYLIALKRKRKRRVDAQRKAWRRDETAAGKEGSAKGSFGMVARRFNTAEMDSDSVRREAPELLS